MAAFWNDVIDPGLIRDVLPFRAGADRVIQLGPGYEFTMT